MKRRTRTINGKKYRVRIPENCWQLLDLIDRSKNPNIKNWYIACLNGPTKSNTTSPKPTSPKPPLGSIWERTFENGVRERLFVNDLDICQDAVFFVLQGNGCWPRGNKVSTNDFNLFVDTQGYKMVVE